MKAYRLNLMGNHDYYLITEKQKPLIEEMMKKPSAVVSIGNDTIRASAIKSITQTSVDLPSCPDYFREFVKAEKSEVPDTTPKYRRLPTEWIIITTTGKYITDDLSRQSEDTIARMLMGDPNNRYIIAKCHYEIGSDGEKQYYTQLDQIPEALKKRPDPDWPFGSPITQIYRYGERLIDKNGKIKGID